MVLYYASKSRGESFSIVLLFSIILSSLGIFASYINVSNNLQMSMRKLAGILVRIVFDLYINVKINDIL